MMPCVLRRQIKLCVCLKEQLLGRISRFRRVPLIVPVAFYYCYIFIFYHGYSQGYKATLLVHLSCSGQQIRTLMKSLQTCMFKPVVFTSVRGSCGWTDLSWGSWKFQILAVCYGWSNNPNIWITWTTVRIVGSCRHHVGFMRDVERETLRPAWRPESLGRCWSNPGEEEDENCNSFALLACLSIPYNFSDLLDISEVLSLMKKSVQLPAPILAGWDRFIPIDRFIPLKSPIKPAIHQPSGLVEIHPLDLNLSCHCFLIYHHAEWIFCLLLL